MAADKNENIEAEDLAKKIKKKKKEEKKEREERIKQSAKRLNLGDKKIVELGSEKIRARDLKIRALKIGILIILLFLIIIYFLLRLFFNGGAFTVALSQGLDRDAGLVMYERADQKNYRKILKVDDTEKLDNISINWLPSNIDNMGDGSHNKKNQYIAYTFYLENRGVETINYWYRLTVEDVVKNVDEAIRIMIIRNEERTVYAKPSHYGGPERGTESFISDEIITEKQREGFAPDAVDKYTIVIWIEGDDPECLDPLIGGLMKIRMDMTEQRLSPDDLNSINSVYYE